MNDTTNETADDEALAADDQAAMGEDTVAVSDEQTDIANEAPHEDDGLDADPGVDEPEHEEPIMYMIEKAHMDPIIVRVNGRKFGPFKLGKPFMARKAEIEALTNAGIETRIV